MSIEIITNAIASLTDSFHAINDRRWNLNGQPLLRHQERELGQIADEIAHLYQVLAILKVNQMPKR